MSSHLDRFLSVQVYPEQNDNLQEKTPNNKIWDKEIEVGLKLVFFSKFSFIFPGLLSGGAGCSGRARAPGTAAGAESGAGGGKEAGAGEGKRQGQGIGLKKLLEELQE